MSLLAAAVVVVTTPLEVPLFRPRKEARAAAVQEDRARPAWPSRVAAGASTVEAGAEAVRQMTPGAVAVELVQWAPTERSTQAAMAALAAMSRPIGERPGESQESSGAAVADPPIAPQARLRAVLAALVAVGTVPPQTREMDRPERRTLAAAVDRRAV